MHFMGKIFIWFSLNCFGQLLGENVFYSQRSQGIRLYTIIWRILQIMINKFTTLDKCYWMKSLDSVSKPTNKWDSVFCLKS